VWTEALALKIPALVAQKLPYDRLRPSTMAILSSFSQGFLGMRCALVHPERVHAVILIAARAGKDDPAIRQGYKKMPGAWIANRLPEEIASGFFIRYPNLSKNDPMLTIRPSPDCLRPGYARHATRTAEAFRRIHAPNSVSDNSELCLAS
jgi:pimeloyl-ACP methyl ester carboxylesterase